MKYEVWGVDPGLVDTGIVQISFDTDTQRWYVNHTVFKGVVDARGTRRIPSAEIADYLNAEVPSHAVIYIEAYRPRSHYQNDAEMGRAINDLKARVKKAKSLDNTGMKKVVKPALMQRLNVWAFSTKTHHQDLRSAAMIALYGMLKDEVGNSVLVQFICDELVGRPWAQVAFV